MCRDPGIYLRTCHLLWDFTSATGVAFIVSDQACYSSDSYLSCTTSFSLFRLVGVLNLYVILVPKKQKNLTFLEHCDIIISIKVMITTSVLCL